MNFNLSLQEAMLNLNNMILNGGDNVADIDAAIKKFGDIWQYVYIAIAIGGVFMFVIGIYRMFTMKKDKDKNVQIQATKTFIIYMSFAMALWASPIILYLGFTIAGQITNSLSSSPTLSRYLNDLAKVFSPM